MRIITQQEIDAIQRTDAGPRTGAPPETRERDRERGHTAQVQSLDDESDDEAEATRREFPAESVPIRPDTLLERAIGLIPAFAITFWISLTAVAPQWQSAEWITFGVSWFVCFGVLWQSTKEPNNIADGIETAFGKRNRIAHILIPTLMFPLYVYTLGGPFDAYAWYTPSIGTYGLVIFLGLTAVFFPEITSVGLSENESQPA